MRELSKEEFELNISLYREQIVEEGALFIYPTDTIYGIGCDARNEAAVRRLREVKERTKRPLSVIAPHKQWILDYCVVGEKEQAWVEKLPGPYTLILKLKAKDAVCKSVNEGLGTLGVRIPDHWFGKVVARLGVPIVTTSANISGETYMTSIDDLDPKLKHAISFIVYEGELHGRPSTIVDLAKEGLDIIKR